MRPSGSVENLKDGWFSITVDHEQILIPSEVCWVIEVAGHFCSCKCTVKTALGFVAVWLGIESCRYCPSQFDAT